MQVSVHTVYRLAVQQPDCLGVITVTKTSSARFDALVSFFGGKQLEQAMGGMAGVFYDIVGFFQTTCGVDAVKTRKSCTNDSLCGSNSPLQFTTVLHSCAAIPHCYAAC